MTAVGLNGHLRGETFADNAVLPPPPPSLHERKGILGLLWFKHGPLRCKQRRHNIGDLDRAKLFAGCREVNVVEPLQVAR